VVGLITAVCYGVRALVGSGSSSCAKQGTAQFQKKLAVAPRDNPWYQDS
jgi:hypothetical protein